LKLYELAKEIDAATAAGRLEEDARDLTHDSRACAPGTVFVAIRGEKTDAHRFIPQAVERGAIAIISEQSVDASAAPAWIQVRDVRRALALGASVVHQRPSERLKLVGITGTNGKTTTAHLIDSIIRVAEGTSAMFGTISHRVGEEAVTAQHTTPESADIQRMLARAVAAGCRSAVMEVSSHAIELRRADALKFAVAVFTNLTRDHLDYHKTMDAYFAAKERLFNGTMDYAPLASIINIDDEYGRRLLRTARGERITYGLSEEADVRTSDYRVTGGGIAYTARTPAGPLEIESPLVGRPHVYNTLAAIAAGLALGANPEPIARGINGCDVVAGRFEQVTVEGKSPAFTVIVDYAHTDDALKNVLQTAREIAAGNRVIVVFGCGGDRDRTKRAPMGEIAATLADVAIATSDNPRSEDPEAILDDIEVGLKRSGLDYMRIVDRREAIFRAVSEARAGDVVLIAGKGHETYQILGGRTIHFDDREVAREAMLERAAASKVK
jgi:UDP-N-acetylmuramoyl-L-alanyl-D-glutamate--2,6-diaminopimelate ligase